MRSAWATAPVAPKVVPPAPDPAETVKLAEFTVSTARDVGYFSSDTAAGSVLAGKPIKELALSISLVNRELLDDLQTMNIAEAMQFSASFSPESGLVRGHGAQMNAEGQFTNRVGNSTNGVPESGAVERIELIKGPPSVLMSSASAGGAVNITPKRPKGTNFAEAEFQYGNFQTRYRTEINRVLSRKLGTRIGIQYTEADFNGGSLFGQSNLPEIDRDRRLLVFNSTEWRPFPNTVLGVDVEQVRDRSRPGNRTALRFATVRTHVAQRTTQMAFRGLFDYAIRDTKHQVVMKYNHYTFYADSQSYRACTPGTNPLTGLTAANEIKGPWHRIEGASADQMNGYDRGFPRNLTCPWRYTQDAHDNPRRHQGNIIYTGEYPTRIGTFFPLVGISCHSQIESYQTRCALVAGALTNPRTLGRPHRWGSAPSAGVVYQINPSVGIYSSFLESFQVPTHSNSFNELLPNREGVSYETGIEIDLYDRKVTGTFNYFDTTDKNRSVTDSSAFNVSTRDINGNGPRDAGFDPNNLAANTSRGDTVAVGEYNSKGWDFEVTLALARGLQAMLSATLVEAAVTQDPNPSFIGQKNGGFAERNYGAVVSYRFLGGELKGLSLGSGYRYTSDRYLSRVRQFTTVVGSPFATTGSPRRSRCWCLRNTDSRSAGATRGCSATRTIS